MVNPPVAPVAATPVATVNPPAAEVVAKPVAKVITVQALSDIPDLFEIPRPDTTKKAA